MLVILPAWILITFLCWAWGMLVIGRIRMILKDDRFDLPDFSIVCMTGLAFLTVFAAIISLFMPLGNWIAHLILIIPCLLLLFRRQYHGFFSQLREQFSGLHTSLLFFLIAVLAMLLIMSTWKVNHPDTLTYHAQTIKWIEKYKAVPGLVHLHVRYGYQGLWFVAEAFFNLRFAGIETLTLINSAVVLWYFLFLIQKINKCLRAGEGIYVIAWLLLFVISCLSYTQVRLTITSASPDFITALFLWLIFYLCVKTQKEHSSVHWLMMIALSLFAISLKLSAFPVILITVYSAVQLWRQKKLKALLISVIVSALILVPFFARNIITTGYPAFPSAFPDITQVDWKYDKNQTQFEKKYITAYARAQVDYDEAKVKAAMAMPANEWLPKWWKNHRDVDKAILVLLLLSVIAALIRIKLILQSSAETKVAIMTSAAGIVFWFIQAPDPRFGFGFIIAFIAMITALLLSHSRIKTDNFKRITVLLIAVSAIIVSGYTIYRSVRFFSPKQLVKPSGIENFQVSKFDCRGIQFNRPVDKGPCGDLPVPCIYADSCTHFELRGNTISDGFRASK